MSDEQAKVAGDQVMDLTRFLPIRQVCTLVGFSKSTILRKIEGGDFPPPVIRDGNVTRWSESEIRQWQARQFAKREKRLHAAQAAA